MAIIGRKIEQKNVGHDQYTGWIEEKKVAVVGRSS